MTNTEIFMSKVIFAVFDFYSKTYRSQNYIIHVFSSFLHRITIFPIYWIIHSKNNFKKILSLKSDLISQNRKASCLTLIDALFSFYFFGFFIYEYETYKFEQKTIKERFSFASEFDLWKFVNCFDKRSEINKLVDKEKSYEIFKDAYNRDVIAIKNNHDYQIFDDFVNRHPTFFAKPLRGAFGKDSGIINIKNFNSNKDAFNNLISENHYILEEVITQCQEMAQFNPSSVNTVRTTMLRTKDGVKLLFGFIRNGRQGIVVDNGGEGGIVIPYNCQNGKLYKYGFDENGNKYVEHPDSKITYKNFQIPKFDEIVKLSVNLMKRIPKLNYVGFDIAIRDNDLVVLEVNHATQFFGLQCLVNEGFHKEIEEIMLTNNIPTSFWEKQKAVFN